MNRNSLYRAVWRWHFYAGLLVLPVLLWMATTGGIYLYKNEIERALFGRMVELPTNVRPAPLGTLIEEVERQTGSKVTQITRPAAANESWRFAIKVLAGPERTAFVRPDNGRVLGIAEAGGPMELIKRLHSLTAAGPIANYLVEAVAGWTLVLTLTGFYLWWPRGANKALSLAGRVGERRFWRNVHASTGLLVGGIIFFLALSGMPWTAFWGAGFHQLVAAEGIGRPPAPGPAGSEHAGHEEHLSWSLRGRPEPRAGGHGDVGPDAVVSAATARGLGPSWVLDLPDLPGKPYRIAPAIERAEDARVIYVEPASGRILQDNDWRQFGVGAKAFEWGIATHQGLEFGEPNRLIMLLGCIGVWLLAISAPVMWWKRRKGGQLAAPPRAADPRQAQVVAAIMLVIGALFPLTGLTMVLALGGEWCWRRVQRVRQR